MIFPQHDLHRKPQGIIVLNESCRVSRADGSNTFEIATGTKNYYLTADSQPIMEEWVRVLQNVVQRNALRLLLSREDQKPTLQAWLIKVKHGHSRKCWCVLIGKMFIYFRTPNEQVSEELHQIKRLRSKDLKTFILEPNGSSKHAGHQSGRS